MYWNMPILKKVVLLCCWISPDYVGVHLNILMLYFIFYLNYFYLTSFFIPAHVTELMQGTGAQILTSLPQFKLKCPPGNFLNEVSFNNNNNTSSMQVKYNCCGFNWCCLDTHTHTDRHIHIHRHTHTNSHTHTKREVQIHQGKI